MNIVDIDECRGTHACENTSSTCVNTPGSYQCECRSGFRKIPKNNTNCQGKFYVTNHWIYGLKHYYSSQFHNTSMIKAIFIPHDTKFLSIIVFNTRDLSEQTYDKIEKFLVR